MAFTLNANEFLAIAEEIMRNGAVFYGHLAEYAAHTESKTVLLELTEMQLLRQESFADMRSSLTEEQKSTTHFHPGTDEWIYISGFVDKHVYDISRDPCEIISNEWQPVHMLKAAADIEKDSLIFFLELQQLVLSRDRCDLIDKVIRQQLNILFWLSDRIGLLKESLQRV